MTVRRAGFPARRRQVRAPPVLPALARKAGSAALWGAGSSHVGAGCDGGRHPGTAGLWAKARQVSRNHIKTSHIHAWPRALFEGRERLERGF